jgi:hypothetical protein
MKAVSTPRHERNGKVNLMARLRLFPRYRQPWLALMLALGAVLSGQSAAAVSAAPKAPAVLPEAAASQARMRLLSQEQFFNSLGYIFGPDIAISSHFAPLRRTDGLLASGASVAGVTIGQMQEFQRTAGALAAAVVSPQNRGFLVPCTPRRADAPDRSCASRFLLPVARLLHRRTLDREQQAAVLDVAGAAADRLQDFHAGLGVALEGLLISPETLFLIERSEADPMRPGLRRLDAYSLASRLSFFLWNAGPDEELLAAAETGALHTPKGLSRALDRMLSSPRLETGVRAFFDDLLRFDDLAVIAKDPNIYPAFSGETVGDAREQTLRTIVDHLLTRGLDYRDLFTTRDTFLSPSLAVLYGVPAPPGWTPYRSPEGSQRVGLLTQISFLAAHAHPGRSSPTLRGKGLREQLLCQQVPRPPPNVDFSLVENPDSTLRTARERLVAHRSNPVCAGCHKITDPIGLALEHFDGAGQYRDTEKGAVIDVSGALDGKAFADVVGLASVLRENPLLPACLVKRVYSYGTGGPSAATDKPVLAWLGERFAEDGYRLPDLLRTLALSQPFAVVTDAGAMPQAVTATRSAVSPHESNAAAVPTSAGAR